MHTMNDWMFNDTLAQKNQQQTNRLLGVKQILFLNKNLIGDYGWVKNVYGYNSVKGCAK